MRKIGQLRDERQARIFSDALYARGLENDVESEDDGAFSIWVHDDDQLSQGRALLERFVLAPEAPEWQAAPQEAKRLRKEEDRAETKRKSNVITRERIDYERNYAGFAWVPLLLTILSIAATFWAGDIGFGLGASSHREDEAQYAERQARAAHLFIENPETYFIRKQAAKIRKMMAENGVQLPDGAMEARPPLAEVRKGEVWRLFTPIFLHFGLMHLLFNIIWLRDLGGFLQHRFGALYLLTFILAVAGVSNLVQLASSGPQFGGLSGVNYGLLGFLWMRGKFERGGFWQLNPQIVQFMIVWFVLCFFMPGVANGAHAGGLLFGMASGFLTAQIANARRRQL